MCCSICFRAIASRQTPSSSRSARDGQRNPRGNLCASNDAAIAIACEGALRYMRENPECALLHIWGADVHEGAWCRCSQCAPLSPQRQYLKVVNAIAEAVAEGIRRDHASRVPRLPRHHRSDART